MLIVLNADDFGSSDDTVNATIECFEQEALTSATIMPGMPATDAALKYALSRPDLDFGVHLTFTGDGIESPVSPPEAIPALVDDKGHFLTTGVVRRLALLGRLPVPEIERELAAQIGAVRDAGVPVSHVDSHRHLHKLGPFRAALARVLPTFGIERVRNTQDVYLRRPLRRPTYWLGWLWRRQLAKVFMTTAHFYMPTSRGDTAWDGQLIERIMKLTGPSLEVGVHPGFVDPWRSDERLSLLAFADWAASSGHRLVGWSDVGRS